MGRRGPPCDIAQGKVLSKVVCKCAGKASSKRDELQQQDCLVQFILDSKLLAIMVFGSLETRFNCLAWRFFTWKKYEHAHHTCRGWSFPPFSSFSATALTLRHGKSEEEKKKNKKRDAPTAVSMYCHEEQSCHHLVFGLLLAENMKTCSSQYVSFPLSIIFVARLSFFFCFSPRL